MNILFLVSGISSPAGWGTEYIQNLITALSKRGVRSTIVSPILLYTNNDWREWIKKQYDSTGVRIIPINTPYWLKRRPVLNFCISSILSTFVVFRLLMTREYDAIHEFSSIPVILFRSLLFKLLFDTPTIFTLSVYNTSVLGNFKWFKLLNVADFYAIPSKEIMARLLEMGIPLNKVYFIRPGINLSIFAKKRDVLAERKSLSLPPKKFILTYYGTLTKEKGVLDLVCAYMNLDKRERDEIMLCFYVVWRGSQEHKKIKHYIMSLNQENIKIFEGYTNIPSIIWASNAIILPQQTGTGTTIPPISIIEVLAAKRMLISTDTIGNREIVQEGFGILIPPNNPARLTNAIKSVYNHKPIAGKKNKIFQASLKKFRISAVVRQYLTLYSRLQ